MSRPRVMSIGDAPCNRPCHYIGCSYMIDGHCHDNDWCEHADGAEGDNDNNDNNEKD
ncbi:MAG: hypothetical protein J6V72_19940 [Kiritimatiellae bacterium]|nr:hypothetical protein [Kiritimatiellia bacterium]